MADDNDETMATSEVEDVDEKDETFAMNDSDAGSDADSDDGSEDDYIEGKKTTKKVKKSTEKKKTTTVRRPRKTAQREYSQNTIDVYSQISEEDIIASTEGLTGIKIPVRISFSTSSKAK
jgi:hypothetical protein